MLIKPYQLYTIWDLPWAFPIIFHLFWMESCKSDTGLKLMLWISRGWCYEFPELWRFVSCIYIQCLYLYMACTNIHISTISPPTHIGEFIFSWRSRITPIFIFFYFFFSQINCYLYPLLSQDTKNSTLYSYLLHYIAYISYNFFTFPRYFCTRMLFLIPLII